MQFLRIAMLTTTSWEVYQHLLLDMRWARRKNLI